MSITTATTVRPSGGPPLPPRPDPDRAVVTVAAPGDGAGLWAGGPSAAVDPDGTVHLAYRLRRPVGEGRGYAVAIARSTDGGESFTEVARLLRDDFDCDSLERPSLVRKPDGGWRLYLSLATPGTLHWHVVAIDADDPRGFDPSQARSVLRGARETLTRTPSYASERGAGRCGPVATR